MGDDITRDRIAGRYEVLASVGAGGMGAVYKVKDTQLDEVVALKLIRAELGQDPTALERFKSEVKLARKVTHKNVARVFDIGEHERRPFLTMELVDGEALDDRLLARGPCSVREAARLVRTILSGLGAAHDAGVVHRDLKPANVLIERAGRVVLTDFGIAKPMQPGLTRATLGPSTIVGTPAYMAPEQVEGGTVDARSDLYAVGIILFELVTGRLPFQGDTPIAMAASRLTSEPLHPATLRPGLPEALCEVVLRALARSPAARFGSAEEMSTALEGWSGVSESGLPPPQSFAPVTHSREIVTAETEIALEVPKTTPFVTRALGQIHRTLAVLPLENLGPTDDELLARGLTQELRDALSTLSGVRIMSSLPAEVALDLGKLARERGVEVCVQGSFRRLDGGVRVSLRLLSPEDGIQIWARRFESSGEDTLLIADEAARAIAEALAIQHAPLARHATTDPVAVELYLRARSAYQRAWLADIEKAVELFEEAAGRAPDNHAIVSGLALARVRLWFFRPELRAQAVQAVERAVALAPDAAETRLARASMAFQLCDEAAALTEALQVVRSAPGLSEGHLIVGRILCEIGRVEDGMRFLERALLLDPTQEYARREFGRALALLGRWDDALLLLDPSDVDPSVSASRAMTRGRFAFWQRDVVGARGLTNAIAKATRPGLTEIDDAQSIVFSIDHVMQNAAKLPGSTQELLTRTDDNPRRVTFFAQLAAEVEGYREDLDACLGHLERAADLGVIDILWLERCPLLAEARTSPRYAAVEQRIRARAEGVAAAYDSAMKRTR